MMLPYQRTSAALGFLILTFVLAVNVAKAAGPNVKAVHGVAAGRDIYNSKITIGLTSEEVAQLIKVALADNKDDIRVAREKIEQLGKALGVHQDAIKRFLKTLGQNEVPQDRLVATLETLAEDYKTLMARMKSGVSSGVAAKEQVLLQSGNFEELERLFSEVQRSDEKELERIASNYFNHGKLSAMQLKPLDTVSYYAKAYQLQSENVEYSYAYATALVDQNNYAVAEPILTKAITLLRQKGSSDKDKLSIGQHLNILGVVYKATQRFEESELAYQEALKINTSFNAQDQMIFDLRIAMNKINLGGLYYATNKYKLAKDMFESALMTYNKYPSCKRDVVMALSNLGATYNALLQFDKAEKAYKDAVSLYQQSSINQNIDDPDIGAVFNNLGGVYKDTLRFKDAELAYLEAVSIRRRSLKDNPNKYLPWLAATLNNLGALYEKVRRPETALKVIEESIEIRRELVKKDSSANLKEFGIELLNYGVSLKSMRRLKDAEDAYKEALTIFRELAKTDPVVYEESVALSLYNLGLLYQETQRYEESEIAYDECLGIRRKMPQSNPNKDNFWLAQTLHSIGIMYKETQRLELAEKVYLEALAIQRNLAKIHVTYDLDVAHTLHNLGIVYQLTNREKDAEKTYLESLEIRRNLAKLDPEQYETEVQNILITLASLYYRTNRHADAEKAIREANTINCAQQGE